MNKHITSIHNPLVKELALLKTSKGRKKYGLFAAEGLRICSTLIASKSNLVHLYCTSTLLNEAISIAPQERIIIVSDPVMQKISSSKNPSGLYGTFSLPQKPDPSSLTSGIVLAEIQDPGNMGTLIRSSIAFGKKSVVIIQGVDPFCPKVVQASAGTIADAIIFRWSWQELVRYKKEFLLVALVAKGGKNIADSMINADKSLLVVGNEAHGINDTWQEQCDELISLSMPGNVESLNAAIAGSIALYYQCIIKKGLP